MAHDIGSLAEHSDRYLTMAFRTDSHRVMERPDGVGQMGGGCRDAITIYVRRHNAHIEQVSFVTDGCINTAACANAVIELTQGGRIDAAWSISSLDVVDFLETLPPDHVHCADLAVEAFRNALADCHRQARNRWKQPYR